MEKEVRRLYLGIIFILSGVIVLMLFYSFGRETTAYSNGIEKGKLIKMEEFKGIYMPAPPEEIGNPMQ